MKTRNESIELLRIIAMLFIVMLHVSGAFANSEADGSVENALHHAFRSVCFTGVTIFAFISGYFGVKWNGKKFFDYEMMAVTFEIFVFILTILFVPYFSINASLRSLFPISGGSHWYFSAYMFLMLLMKFLPLSAKAVSNSRLVLIMLFLFTFVIQFLFKANGTTFLMLVEIYMIGRCLRLNPIPLIENHCGKIMMLTLSLNAALFFFAAYSKFLNGKLLQVLANNHNPLIFISAISLFYFFKKHAFRTDFGIFCRLASYMFPVYIVHSALYSEGCLNVYMKKNLIQDNIYISFICWSALMFIIPIFLEVIRRKIFSQFNDKLFCWILKNKG